MCLFCSFNFCSALFNFNNSVLSSSATVSHLPLSILAEDIIFVVSSHCFYATCSFPGSNAACIFEQKLYESLWHQIQLEPHHCCTKCLQQAEMIFFWKKTEHTSYFVIIWSLRPGAAALHHVLSPLLHNSIQVGEVSRKVLRYTRMNGYHKQNGCWITGEQCTASDFSS